MNRTRLGSGSTALTKLPDQAAGGCPSRRREPGLVAVVGATVPGLPRVGADDIRRLTEDKAFGIAAMRDLLGVEPIGLEDGLGITLAARRHAA